MLESFDPFELALMERNYNKPAMDCWQFPKNRNMNCGVYRGEFTVFTRFIYLQAVGNAPARADVWDIWPFDRNKALRLYSYMCFGAMIINKKVIFAFFPMYSKSSGYR